MAMILGSDDYDPARCDGEARSMRDRSPDKLTATTYRNRPFLDNSFLRRDIVL